MAVVEIHPEPNDVLELRDPCWTDSPATPVSR